MKNGTVSISDTFYFSSVSLSFCILRDIAGRGGGGGERERGEGGRVTSSETHSEHYSLVVTRFGSLITFDPTLYEQIYLQATGVII